MVSWELSDLRASQDGSRDSSGHPSSQSISHKAQGHPRFKGQEVDINLLMEGAANTVDTLQSFAPISKPREFSLGKELCFV